MLLITGDEKDIGLFHGLFHTGRRIDIDVWIDDQPELVGRMVPLISVG